MRRYIQMKDIEVKETIVKMLEDGIEVCGIIAEKGKKKEKLIELAEELGIPFEVNEGCVRSEEIEGDVINKVLIVKKDEYGFWEEWVPLENVG